MTGAAAVTAETIEVPTDDGLMPVRLFRPSGRPAEAGVLFYMDAFGLRPELDGMCRRYAQQGFATLLPDLFYRLGRVSFPPPRSASEPLDPGMHAANEATTLDGSVRDTGAILRHAAGRSDLRHLRFGAVGHCMGARHALAAAARYGDRIGAASCLHGGRMVWDGPDSPHLLIPEVRGRLYFAFAATDETCPDAHRAIIEATIAACGADATVEHFAAHHGWTFPERWCFDPVAAETAWQRTVDMFRRL